MIIPKLNLNYKQYINRILYLRLNKKIENEYQLRHHILPKCMGGSNDLKNYIWLYASLHYYAHKLLALENPNNEKLIYAWFMMYHCAESKGQDRKYSPLECESLKKVYSVLKSQLMTGKHLQDLIRNKISNSNKGKRRNESHKENIRNGIKNKRRDYNGEHNPCYGRKHTNLEKEKQSINHNPNSGKHVSVYCILLDLYFDTMQLAANYVGCSKSSMTRWFQDQSRTAGVHPVTKEKLHWKVIQKDSV